MTFRSRAAAALACVFALARCVPAPPPAVPPPALAGASQAVPAPQQSADPSDAATARCRIGAQDGPPPAAPTTTGGSAALPAPFQVADRGIGGTSTGDAATPGGTAPIIPAPPARPTAPVDRGIGGTGIVGIVTGFGSICVNGLEVAYDDRTQIQSEPGIGTTDGGPTQDVRAGALAVIAASNEAGALRADQITLRHEVFGPVESVDATGLFVVAGQSVRVTPDTRGIAQPAVGSWVAVSGLRDSDQTVVATRIDAAMPDRVGVHGLLVRDAHGLRIGALLLHVPRSFDVPPEGAVTASGRYLQGILYVDSLLPDLLPTDPSALFAPSTGTFFVESMVGLGFGGVDYDAVRFGGAPAILLLRRQADGSVRGVQALAAPMRYALGIGMHGPARGAIMPNGGHFGTPSGHGRSGADSAGRASDLAGTSPAPVPDERAAPGDAARTDGFGPGRGGRFGRGRRGGTGGGGGGMPGPPGH